jgi:hypothetical protein
MKMRRANWAGIGYQVADAPRLQVDEVYTNNWSNSTHESVSLVQVFLSLAC